MVSLHDHSLMRMDTLRSGLEDVCSEQESDSGSESYSDRSEIPCVKGEIAEEYSVSEEDREAEVRDMEVNDEAEDIIIWQSDDEYESEDEENRGGALL